MKRYYDQNGNEVKFGELVHYSNSNEKSKFELTTTLDENTFPMLVMVGAVKIKNIADNNKTLGDYEKELQTCCGINKTIVKELFPQQYLSMIIALVSDDLEPIKVPAEGSVWFFDYVEKAFVKIPINKEKDYSLMTFFKSKDNADECYRIIKPLIDKINA